VHRRIFGPKRGQIIRGWRKSHNVGLHNMHASPNIIIIIKSNYYKIGTNGVTEKFV
jgi:hypothetical protein